jgi:hypothetical protein
MTLAKLIEELRAIEKRVAALATEAERIKRQSVEVMIGPVEWNGKAQLAQPEPNAQCAECGHVRMGVGQAGKPETQYAPLKCKPMVDPAERGA